MRETLDRTAEEQLLLQNEAKDLTEVKDTDHAYQEIGKKHQLVQTTPEEFPPEHGMAEQEMHDEATGKKLVCETSVCTCALSCLIFTITLYIHGVFSLCQFYHPSCQSCKHVRFSYFQFEHKCCSAALISSTCVHWRVKWKYLNHIQSSQMFVCPYTAKIFTVSECLQAGMIVADFTAWKKVATGETQTRVLCSSTEFQPHELQVPYRQGMRKQRIVTGMGGSRG